MQRNAYSIRIYNIDYKYQIQRDFIIFTFTLDIYFVSKGIKRTRLILVIQYCKVLHCSAMRDLSIGKR